MWIVDWLRNRLNGLADRWHSWSPTTRRAVVAALGAYSVVELWAYVQYRRTLARAQRTRSYPQGDTDSAYREWMSHQLLANMESEPSEAIYTLETVFSHEFKAHEIPRENVLRSLGMNLYFKSLEDWSPEERKHVETMMIEFEEKTLRLHKITFKPGFSERANKVMKKWGGIPLRAWYKPIGFYWFMFAYRKFINALYMARGFVRYDKPNGITFWVRHHGTSKHHPLLFAHGLGIGVAPYVVPAFWFSRDRTVVLVEMPNISYNRWTEHFPTAKQIGETIATMLKELNYHHTRVDVMGHSFGTIVMTYFIRAYPHLCHRRVYVDPCCFVGGAARTVALSTSTFYQGVCQNSMMFPVLHPLNFIARSIICWFISRDIYVQEMSLRHCWGSEFLERGDHVTDNSMILLADKDEILPAPVIYRYVRNNHGNKCHILYHYGNHASFLLNPTLWSGVRRFLDRGRAGMDGESIEDSELHHHSISAHDRRRQLAADPEGTRALMDSNAMLHVQRVQSPA